MKFKIALASAAVISVFALAGCNTNADLNRDGLANNINRTTYTSPRTAVTSAPRTGVTSTKRTMNNNTGYGQGTDSSRNSLNHGLTNNIVRNTGANKTVVNAADTDANSYEGNQRATNVRTQDTLFRSDSVRRDSVNNNDDYGYFDNNMNSGLKRDAMHKELGDNVNNDTYNEISGDFNRPAGVTPLTNTSNKASDNARNTNLNNTAINRNNTSLSNTATNRNNTSTNPNNTNTNPNNTSTNLNRSVTGTNNKIGQRTYDSGMTGQNNLLSH